MVVGAPVLRDDVHLRAALETIFRRVRAHLHVHFGDRVHVGRGAEITAAAAVPAVDAVDVNGLTASTLDVGHGRGEAAAEGFLIVSEERDARQDLEQRNRVAAANREVLHLLHIQHRLLRRLRGREKLSDGTDRHRFAELTDLELERTDREPVVRQHDVGLHLERLESGQRDANRVRSWRQTGKHERADFVCDGSTFLATALVDDRDVGAWYHLCGRVHDGPGQRARHGLRRAVDGEQA